MCLNMKNLVLVVATQPQLLVMRQRLGHDVGSERGAAGHDDR